MASLHDKVDELEITKRLIIKKSALLDVEPGAEISGIGGGGGGAVDSVNSQTGVVVLDADDIDDTSTTHKFVNAAQLSALATAIQPGDNVSDLANDANYLTADTDAVTSVNGATDAVVVDADDIDDTSTTHKFISAAQLSEVATAIQPGDNLSDLTNDTNFIVAAGAPVQSVNTQTGIVSLDADDIDDTSTTHKFASAAQLASIATAIQPGDNISDLTNDASFITAAGAPVQSVNGDTGVVVLAAADIADLGTLATQDADAVTITGGTLSGVDVTATGLTSSGDLSFTGAAPQIATQDAATVGDLLIKAGDTTDTGGDVAGAYLTLQAGAGYQTASSGLAGVGGDVVINGGGQLNTGHGGGVSISGGVARGPGFVGGRAILSGGSGQASSAPGGITGAGVARVDGGNGGAASDESTNATNGGTTLLRGGLGGAVSSGTSTGNGGAGGAASIVGRNGGNAAGSGDGGDGGDISLTPGSGGTSGSGSAGADGKVRVAGQFNLDGGSVPATASDTGEAGDIAWDSGFFYVCTATNTWVRTALATW